MCKGHSKPITLQIGNHEKFEPRMWKNGTLLALNLCAIHDYDTTL